MAQREHFCTIGERHWSFSRAVESVEEIYKESHETQVGSTVRWDQVTQSGGKQRPAHIWKGKQEERPSSVGIDCPDSRPGEKEVDDTESPASQEGARDGCARQGEHRGGVECDDVDYRTHTTS